MAVNWVSVIKSSFKYFCHHNGDLAKVFGHLHHSGVPFFSPLIVFPCVPCLTMLIHRGGSVYMVVPVYCCKLLSCFVNLIPRPRKFIDSHTHQEKKRNFTLFIHRGLIMLSVFCSHEWLFTIYRKIPEISVGM